MDEKYGREYAGFSIFPFKFLRTIFYYKGQRITVEFRFSRKENLFYIKSLAFYGVESYIKTIRGAPLSFKTKKDNVIRCKMDIEVAAR